MKKLSRIKENGKAQSPDSPASSRGRADRLPEEESTGLRLDRLYDALNRIGAESQKEPTREALLRKVCEILASSGGFMIAWIGWLNRRTRVVVPAYFAGARAQSYLEKIRITVEEGEEGKGPTGTALRTGKPYVCNDFYSDPGTPPWREAAERAGLSSSAAYPLRCGAEICGTLNVYSDKPNAFSERVMMVLDEITSEISYGLYRIEEESRSKAGGEEGGGVEKAFRDFAECADEILWIADLHPELIIYVNPAFERIWGRKPAELYREPRLWMDSIHIDDRAFVMESYGNWIEGVPGATYDVQYRIVRPDREVRWIADRGFVLGTEHGKFSRVGGIATDVTQRKVTEEAVRKSEERLRGTLDSLLEGCMIIGFDWTYIYVNDSAARHGHKDRDSLIGRKMTEMYPGVEKSAVFERYKDCMDHRRPQLFEESFTFDDGRTNRYEFRVAPVPEGIFVLSLDVTEFSRDRERKEGG